MLNDMNQQEIIEKYQSLKDYMIESRDTDNMMLFGDVMDELIERLAKNDTAFAEREVEKLEAMMWRQYLTKSEAEDIIAHMDPPAPWNYSTWVNAMDNSGLGRVHEDVFNEYALWVTMNGIMSDHKDTLTRFIGDSGQLLQMVYDLAIDKLNDKDERFDVREYYL